MDDWDEGQPRIALRRAEYLRSISVWPGTTQLDHHGWMANFEGRDAELAGYLLDSFVFISSTLTKALFTSAFHQLSSYTHLQRAGRRRDEVWAEFIARSVITHVEGETPSTTDSGYLFARLAKRHLGIPEAQVVTPEIALRIFNANNQRSVIFVDDFLGSGDQMAETWARMYGIASGVESSFAESARHIPTPVYFVPLLATASGIEALKHSCPSLIVLPTHVITEDESPVSQNSIYWPPDIREEGIAFVERSSLRAGITRCSWKGYRDLALGISFDHGTPDATLPLFTHESDSWRPLVK